MVRLRPIIGYSQEEGMVRCHRCARTRPANLTDHVSRRTAPLAWSTLLERFR